MMLKSKFIKMFIALLIIYVIWSLYIDVINLCERVDNEALVPCLMYLPPLGFLGLGFLVFKIIQSTFTLRLIKKIFRRNKK